MSAYWLLCAAAANALGAWLFVTASNQAMLHVLSSMFLAFLNIKADAFSTRTDVDGVLLFLCFVVKMPSTSNEFLVQFEDVLRSLEPFGGRHQGFAGCDGILKLGRGDLPPPKIHSKHFKASSWAVANFRSLQVMLFVILLRPTPICRHAETT